MQHACRPIGNFHTPLSISTGGLRSARATRCSSMRMWCRRHGLAHKDAGECECVAIRRTIAAGRSSPLPSSDAAVGDEGLRGCTNLGDSMHKCCIPVLYARCHSPRVAVLAIQ